MQRCVCGSFCLAGFPFSSTEVKICFLVRQKLDNEAFNVIIFYVVRSFLFYAVTVEVGCVDVYQRPLHEPCKLILIRRLLSMDVSLVVIRYLLFLYCRFCKL